MLLYQFYCFCFCNDTSRRTYNYMYSRCAVIRPNWAPGEASGLCTSISVQLHETASTEPQIKRSPSPIHRIPAWIPVRFNQTGAQSSNDVSHDPEGNPRATTCIIKEPIVQLHPAISVFHSHSHIEASRECDFRSSHLNLNLNHQHHQPQHGLVRVEGVRLSGGPLRHDIQDVRFQSQNPPLSPPD